MTRGKLWRRAKGKRRGERLALQTPSGPVPLYVPINRDAHYASMERIAQQKAAAKAKQRLDRQRERGRKGMARAEREVNRLARAGGA